MNLANCQNAIGLASLVALLTSGPVMGEVLSDCVKIAQDAARLACYDRVTSTGTSGKSTPDAPEPAPLAKQHSPQPAQAATPAAPAMPVSPPAAKLADAPVASRPQAPAGDFGFETKRGEDVEEIRSRYVGQFAGWSGRTLFRLENGQVWKQSESGRFSYHKDSPVITIRRAAFGSFRLQVDGLNRSVRVKRIK